MPAPERAAPATVTTTDLLKCVAIVCMVLDHIGHFLFPDEPGWRVVGRLAAPVFFFLIGYGRIWAVPRSWLAFGLILTALDIASPQGSQHLNILIVFATLRILFALAGPWLRLRWQHPWLLAGLFALALPFAGEWIEYGMEGPLIALAGWLAREAADTPDEGRERALLQARLMLGLALAVYFGIESVDYGFRDLWLKAFIGLVAGLGYALATFRRADVPLAAPTPVLAGIRLGGRWSLEIYALHLIALYLLFWTPPA